MDIKSIAKQAGFVLSEDERVACEKKLNTILEEAKRLPEVEDNSKGERA